MTRLPAVAALAASITGCATPYGIHAHDGPGALHGHYAAQGPHAARGHHAMHGPADMQAQGREGMGGCMHGMQRQAGDPGMRDERHPGMQHGMQAGGKGMHRMCEASPAQADADAQQK